MSVTNIFGTLVNGGGRDTTVTAQRLQMASKANEAQQRINDERALTDDERTRLQVLVADLLSENQKLRFEVAQLVQQARRAERALVEAIKQGGIPF